MAEKTTIQIEQESQISKFDGKLIVDEYQALERIIARLEAIYNGYYSIDEGPTVIWCSILEDEGYRALEQIMAVRDELKNRSTVVEYIEAAERKYGYKLQPV